MLNGIFVKYKIIIVYHSFPWNCVNILLKLHILHKLPLFLPYIYKKIMSNWKDNNVQIV